MYCNEAKQMMLQVTKQFDSVEKPGAVVTERCLNI